MEASCPDEGKTITAIKAQKGRKDRVNVFLNGRYSLGLSLAVIEEAGVRVGKRLTDHEIESLAKSELLCRSFNAALHYLSYRPRSEAELRTRLHRRNFDHDTIERVIVKLKEQQLLDDAAFAQFWKENRDFFSPRSKRLIKLELRRKGVASEVADEATSELDDEASAYRAALKKSQTWANLDYQSFRKKLGGSLQRRGFSYQVIGPIVERLWRERTDQAQRKS